VNRIAMGGLACGLALLAIACSSSSAPTTGGPFRGKGSTIPETVCDWTTPGGVVYDGFDAFQNAGGTATISRAALAQPRELRLVAAWVVPIAGTPLVGVGQGYPSASGLATTAPGTQWQRRQRVPGAVVGHTPGHDLYNLVLVVKPSGTVGTANAINLYYQTGGTHYLMHLPHGLKIWVGPSQC